MKRYYIRMAPYALAEAIAALERDECVSDIRIGMEDGDLTVTYEYDKYAMERRRAKPETSDPTVEPIARAEKNRQNNS